MVAMKAEVSGLSFFPHLVLASAFLSPIFICEENGTRSPEAANFRVSQAFWWWCGRQALASHRKGEGSVSPSKFGLGTNRKVKERT